MGRAFLEEPKKSQKVEMMKASENQLVGVFDGSSAEILQVRNNDLGKSRSTSHWDCSGSWFYGMIVDGERGTRSHGETLFPLNFTQQNNSI